MDITSLAVCVTALTTVAVGVALVTDVRWRRIPNALTFPVILSGLALRVIYQGWEGLGLSLCGMLTAPVLLIALHGGRGLGMGDVKLAAAVGAMLGPPLAMVAAFLTALSGGCVALVVQVRKGGVLADTLSTLGIGLPFLDRWARRTHGEGENPWALTMPYGVAIAIGSILALVVYWCTEGQRWHL